MSILEKEMTKYPLKVKSEIAALGHLQKGLTVIEKNQEAKIAKGQPFDTIEGHFQKTSELSDRLVQLMKYCGNSVRPEASGNMIDRVKLQNIKKVKAQANAQMVKVTDKSRDINA